MVVRDLLTYNNLERTRHIFGLTKGVLQSIQVSYKVFYHMNLRILECLHFDLLYEVFKSFEKDVIADIPPEALVLLKEGVCLKTSKNHHKYHLDYTNSFIVLPLMYRSN